MTPAFLRLTAAETKPEPGMPIILASASIERIYSLGDDGAHLVLTSGQELVVVETQEQIAASLYAIVVK